MVSWGWCYSGDNPAPGDNLPSVVLAPMLPDDTATRVGDGGAQAATRRRCLGSNRTAGVAAEREREGEPEYTVYHGWPNTPVLGDNVPDWISMESTVRRRS